MTTFYETRRKKLLESDEPRLYCLTSYDALQGKRDDAMPFKQEANFEYLTGIKEPGWKFGLDTATQSIWLCMPERSEVQRIFDGGLSKQAAIELSGIDDIIDTVAHQARLTQHASKNDTIYAVLPDKNESYYAFVPNPALKKHATDLKKIFKNVADARQSIAALRAIKTEDEIELMRGAIAVTMEAFRNIKATVSDKTHEYEIEASLSFAFRNTGAGGHAYEPIVAAGLNACTLHYNTNNDLLPRNGLVLIDAGVMVQGYAADITRTYQIGQVSERQHQVHQAVEAAHHEIIALIKPGVQLSDYQEKVDTIMKRALISLGLIQNEADTKGYCTYFPHAISHGLGLDVHESLGGFKTFQPGMVLTVEPGIYIPEESIGVRIEDDILVTAEGNENLSVALSTAL